jgi:hypothetical protein
VGERKTYPSDLTDEQWAVVGPFLGAWKAKHPSVSGQQGRYQLREIVNATQPGFTVGTCDDRRSRSLSRPREEPSTSFAEFLRCRLPGRISYVRGHRDADGTGVKGSIQMYQEVRFDPVMVGAAIAGDQLGTSEAGE